MHDHGKESTIRHRSMFFAPIVCRRLTKKSSGGAPPVWRATAVGGLVAVVVVVVVVVLVVVVMVVIWWRPTDRATAVHGWPAISTACYHRAGSMFFGKYDSVSVIPPETSEVGLRARLSSV